MTSLDLGFDLGTSVTKVVGLGGNGAHVADFSVPTTWKDLGAGCFERDAQSAVSDVEELLVQVSEAAGPSVNVRSIGFTSMAESGVLVDEQGCAQSPIIAWHDPRGDTQAAALPPGIGDQFSARTGLPVDHVATFFKLAWMRDEGMSLKGLQWLSVPEFVVMRLGGDRVAELSLMGRTGLLDVHTLAPWTPALDHLGVDESFVPRFVGAGTPAGSVRSNHPVTAVRGAVLTVAGHDHAVAAAATGCGRIGATLDSFGTAEAYVSATPRVPSPRMVDELCALGICTYPHVVRGTTALIGGTRTGLVLKRVQSILGAEHDPARTELDRCASELPAGSVTDVEVTGYGMADHDVTVSLASDGPTPARVWRAAIDGGTQAGAAVLDRLRDHGVPVHRLVVAGGWSRMPSVMAARRSLADLVERSTLDQAGTHGAARFARWAASGAAGPYGDRRPPADWFDDSPSTGGPTTPTTRHPWIQEPS